MIKLLRSEYRRLFRSKIFILGSGVCFAFGLVLSLYSVWMNKKFDDQFFVDDDLFMFATFCGVLSAILTSLFVGKLYSDGTIRNQIIMGHKRSSIYLCEYLVSFSADVLFYFSYVLGKVIVLYPVFKEFHDPAKMLMIKTLITIGIIAVYTAVFVLISILNQNKAVSAIICLLASFGILFSSMIIFSALSEPEIYPEAYYLDTETNQLVKKEAMPNPNYVDGTRREVYEFLNDYLPAGQAFQVGGNYDEVNVKGVFLIYDAFTVFIAYLGGIVIYKRKDLK